MQQQVRALMAQNQLLASRISALEKIFIGYRIDPGWIADPAPDGGGWSGGGGGVIGPGIDPIFDPNPEELGKWSKVQFESRLADIAHFRTKLDSLEKLLKTEMKRF